ncbi:MAG: MBOAT family O-acyltransferase [Bacteroidota bacterium]
MLFNSIEYVIFLPTVFLLYWFVINKNLKTQNFLLLTVSYIFYGWWDWRFLSLIIISSFADYFLGRLIHKTDVDRKRKIILGLSIAINLGFLGFFKYYNFFIDSFVEAFASSGIHIHSRTLNIILPVGISFYTFQTLSYTIDIYRRNLEPTRDLIAFFAFVSFFPQLVAGPIERASNLLPQFEKPRQFNASMAKDGMRQILWGLFKKVIIADTAAIYVNEIFGNYQQYSGATLLLGAVYFAFQIYGDFSGYSDIAIGTARLFGFNLMRNFAFPYFSRDIAEFWRRWHISLSSWFRDYLYIPLGGSRGSKWKKIRNVIIIFTVSGFWHVANWTFIFWGFLNGLYFIPLMLMKQNRKNLDIVAKGKLFPSLRETGQILFTFFLTLIAWIFFRANNIGMAFDYIGSMFGSFFKDIPNLSDVAFLLIIALFLVIEWLNRDREYGLERVNMPLVPRWATYLFLGIVLVLSYNNNPSQFIYFQF